MKYLLTLALLLNLTTLLAQSTTIADFRKDHATQQTFFFYPSTLRMVNLEKSPDLYRLVDDVDKLQILLFDRGQIARSTKQQLQEDIMAEQYEELLSFQEEESRVTVYARGNTPQLEGVIGMIDNQKTFALIDLAGFIDLPSLMKVMQGEHDFSSMINIATTVTEGFEMAGQEVAD